MGGMCFRLNVSTLILSSCKISSEKYLLLALNAMLYC